MLSCKILSLFARVRPNSCLYHWFNFRFRSLVANKGKHETRVTDDEARGTTGGERINNLPSRAVCFRAPKIMNFSYPLLLIFCLYMCVID